MTIMKSASIDNFEDNASMNNEFVILDKILLDEKEVAAKIGKGHSEETLANLRKDGKHQIEYIQIFKNYRVLYCPHSLIEYLGERKINNKEEWIIAKISMALNSKNKLSFVNQSQLAKIFGVSSGTIINYLKNENFVQKKNNKMFSVKEIAKWILNNSQKTIYDRLEK